jgi:hypothetical protein
MKFPEIKWPERVTPQPDPPGVTVPAGLVRATEAASWMAYFALVYFLFLYTLDIARDRAGALHLTHFGSWVGDVQFWFPYVIGFAVVAVGIPYVAKIAIPTFTRLSWREAPTEKAWALIIAVCVSFVIIAGTFTVQGDTLLERDRESAVAVDQVAQEAAVLAARIADVQHAMDERTRSESVYVRTAASMSPEAYDRFVESRRGDWQYDRLRSYRAVSEEMVSLKADMAALREQQARATVASSVQGRVATESTGWIALTLGWLEGARAMLLSFVMDIVCLIMPLISLRLKLKRQEQMATFRSEAMPEDHMIPDLRAEAPIASEPMERPREVVRDAETGEELVKVRPREYWRKRGKGKPQQVKIEPENTADEPGVFDARRSGQSPPEQAFEELLDTPAPSVVADGQQQESDDEQQALDQVTLPDYSEDESPAEASDNAGSVGEDNGDGSATEGQHDDSETQEQAPVTGLGVDGDEGVMIDQPVYDHPPAPVTRQLVAAE